MERASRTVCTLLIAPLITHSITVDPLSLFIPTLEFLFRVPSWEEWNWSAEQDQSRHAMNRFVSVNCGTLTETLLESELFGYERGAFTGATEKRKGLFKAAHKGTIFLDENRRDVCRSSSQTIRVLQEGTIRPVGLVQKRALMRLGESPLHPLRSASLETVPFILYSINTWNTGATMINTEGKPFGSPSVFLVPTV
jgi:hypothetical protein